MTLLRIGMSGLERAPRSVELARMRRTLDREGCLLLPGFLSPSLLALMRRGLRGVPYVLRQRGTGPERAVVAHWTLELLAFLLNDPALLRALEGASGCGRIGACVRRKVYRLDAAGQYRKGWHDDAAPGIRLVLSVNLSRGRVRGGSLQVRSRRSEAVLVEHRTDPGGAILISTDPRFQHRVTPVERRGVRVAFAAVFEAGPSYLRRALAAGAGKAVPFPSGPLRLPPGGASWRHGSRRLLFQAPEAILGELDEIRRRFRPLILPQTSA